jgi:hypothetical protein
MIDPVSRHQDLMRVGDWVARSGISVVFSLALLWWVLNQQTVALERITVAQIDLQRAVERLTVRVESGCQPTQMTPSQMR